MILTCAEVQCCDLHAVKHTRVYFMNELKDSLRTLPKKKGWMSASGHQNHWLVMVIT